MYHDTLLPAKMSPLQQHMITNNLSKKLTRQNENTDAYKTKVGMYFTCCRRPTAECMQFSASFKIFENGRSRDR